MSTIDQGMVLAHFIVSDDVERSRPLSGFGWVQFDTLLPLLSGQLILRSPDIEEN
jgi:hypothetical protein